MIFYFRINEGKIVTSSYKCYRVGNLGLNTKPPKFQQFNFLLISSPIKPIEIRNNPNLFHQEESKYRSLLPLDPTTTQ